jgi:hypothetical protein
LRGVSSATLRIRFKTAFAIAAKLAMEAMAHFGEVCPGVASRKEQAGGGFWLRFAAAR